MEKTENKFDYQARMYGSSYRQLEPNMMTKLSQNINRQLQLY